ncbi:hypothetical protein CALVIDRAFT_91953 [Calocera viscosa TUFC12733]|uniref:Uncharacterized protein n=1 Tax=Calocera viscosa (strain TUFC12733) TaxID=1330018 RepID=A0A167MUD1_CALVF|nr:hypothetical protein CALVIDRAFT_91953 [Calocera viscosa TUFC12733]
MGGRTRQTLFPSLGASASVGSARGSSASLIGRASLVRCSKVSSQPTSGLFQLCQSCSRPSWLLTRTHLPTPLSPRTPGTSEPFPRPSPPSPRALLSFYPWSPQPLPLNTHPARTSRTSHARLGRGAAQPPPRLRMIRSLADSRVTTRSTRPGTPHSTPSSPSPALLCSVHPSALCTSVHLAPTPDLALSIGADLLDPVLGDGRSSRISS